MSGKSLHERVFRVCFSSVELTYEKSNKMALILEFYSVKPVLSSHSREARNVAAEGRWLFNTGQIYKETLIWETSKWLLNTGGCLSRFDCKLKKK